MFTYNEIDYFSTPHISKRLYAPHAPAVLHQALHQNSTFVPNFLERPPSLFHQTAGPAAYLLGVDGNKNKVVRENANSIP